MTDSKHPLLIVGSVAFDSVETPAGRVERALGGSASYASIAASYCGAAPRIVGIVGEDFGDGHVERLTRHGVDVAGLERVEGGRTFHWSGRYHDDFKGRDTLETSLNVFERFDPVLPDAWRDTGFLFLGNIAPSLQARVLDQASGARFVAMDTMNFWIDTARADLDAVLSRVDMVFINDEEAFDYTGASTVRGAARALLARGPRHLVIKRGEHGAVLFGEGGPLFVPAVLLERVVDPTGAGDTFAGGFMGTLARHGEVSREAMADALLAGTVLASFCVEAFSVDGIDRLDAGRIAQRRGELEAMIRF